MAEEVEPSTGGGFRIAWDVNITTVLVLVGAIGSAMLFVAQTRSAAETAAANNVRMEAELRSLRDTVANGLDGMRKEIASLPDQRARIEEGERHLTDMDRWRAVFETRVNEVRDNQTQLRSDVDAMMRASNLQLSPRRNVH